MLRGDQIGFIVPLLDSFNAISRFIAMTAIASDDGIDDHTQLKNY